MYNLLIVDDHPYQVESIQQTIRQVDLEIKEVYKAYSATEAMHIMDHVPIDIVITDIRMPEISGIELIEHIRKSSDRVKCILLSGYAEFEYAQQALTLETSSYLMKPVEKRQLISTISSVIKKLTIEREMEREVSQSLYKLRENLPLLRSGMLRDLLSGEQMPTGVLSSRLFTYDIPVRIGDLFSMLVLQLEDDMKDYDTYDISLMMYAITNIIEETFQPHFHVWHTSISSSRIVALIFPLHQENEQIKQLIEKNSKNVQRKIRRYLRQTVSIGIVQPGGFFPDDLFTAYERGATLFYAYHNVGFIACVNELSEPHVQGTIESLYRQPSLMAMLEMKRWEEAGRRLDDVLQELELKSSAAAEYVMEAFHVIAGSYLYVAHRHGKRLKDMFDTEHLGKLRDHNWDLRTFRSWAQQSLADLQTIIGDDVESNEPSLIERIHSFMQTHPLDDLTLQSISDEVGLHPAYLSKLYRQETGKTLSDYLLQARMEHSIELLKNTNFKIYEISNRIGYQTPHYFIKVFKKVYGMTPQQYRMHIRHSRHSY